MQGAWNGCPQGSVVTRSPRSNSSWHTTQAHADCFFSSEEEEEEDSEEDSEDDSEVNSVSGNASMTDCAVGGRGALPPLTLKAWLRNSRRAAIDIPKGCWAD